MPKGTCPDCDGEVQVEANASTGDIIFCDDCDTELELVSLDPVELDVVDNMHEDDEDDEDDEDEY